MRLILLADYLAGIKNLRKIDSLGTLTLIDKHTFVHYVIHQEYIKEQKEKFKKNIRCFATQHSKKIILVDIDLNERIISLYEDDLYIKDQHKIDRRFDMYIQAWKKAEELDKKELETKTIRYGSKEYYKIKNKASRADKIKMAMNDFKLKYRPSEDNI